MDVVEGWNGGRTTSKIFFQGIIKQEVLINPKISGAYFAFEIDTLESKPSRNGKWLNFGLLEDAWHFFTLSLPNNFLKRSSFVGYLNVIGEDYWKKENHKLNCTLK